MAISAVLLDVGGALWPDEWPSTVTSLYSRRLAAALPDVRPKQRTALLNELTAHDPGVSEGESQDTRKGVIATLHATGLSAGYADAVLRAMDLPARGVIEPFPGAKQLLGTIGALGRRCVVFSNATWRSAVSYWRDFRDFSLAPHVDDVISSMDIGARKPSEAMFRGAIDAAGSAPHECVVLGDSEERDIAPAVNLGMRALMVAVEQPSPAHTAAEGVVSSLPDAAAALAHFKRDAEDSA